jgi:hypothetical protein
MDVPGARRMTRKSGNRFSDMVMRKKVAAVPVSGRGHEGDAASSTIFYPGDIDG